MAASTIPHRRADKRSIPLDSEKIRQLREALGWSQIELAKRAKLSNSTIISDIESGERRQNITIETLDKIAGALGVTAKDLLK